MVGSSFFYLHKILWPSPQRKECLFEVSKTTYVWPKLLSDWLMAAHLRVQEHFDGKGGRGAYQNNYLSCLQI
jgi:hypothetical protein